MRSTARAVVIGSGVVGVSTLYHLARKELTSGSTWHADDLLPLFNPSYSGGKIQKYSVALYKTLKAEAGQSVGFEQVSNIRIARTHHRLGRIHALQGRHRKIGIRVNVLTPAHLKDIWPLRETDGLIGVVQHPDDGIKAMTALSVDPDNARMKG